METLTFWIDDMQKANLTGVDNDTHRIDSALLGAIGVDTGTRGTCYFDAFELRSETYIGPEEETLLAELSLEDLSTLEGEVSLYPFGTPEGEPLPEPTETQPISETYTLTSTIAIPLISPEAGSSIGDPPAWLLTETSAQTAALADETELVIDYTYDPLYRLIAADYLDGSYFHFTYDPVGNRKIAYEEVDGKPIETEYVYDDANRLIRAGEAEYTWDDNGNLLDDKTLIYTYSHANRLKTTTNSQGPSGPVTTYFYNGLGDRLKKTIDVGGGYTTEYNLDLASGLTQVLADSDGDTYLYGVGRIAQEDATEMQYFLGDALGSVRQLVGEDGVVTLAKEYQPFGEVLSSEGSGKQQLWICR